MTISNMIGEKGQAELQKMMDEMNKRRKQEFKEIEDSQSLQFLMIEGFRQRIFD